MGFLLRDYFDEKDLYDIFSIAKEERIDKQYYTSDIQNIDITKQLASENIKLAVDFNLKINALKINLKSKEITIIQNKLNSKPSNL